MKTKILFYCLALGLVTLSCRSGEEEAPDIISPPAPTPNPPPEEANTVRLFTDRFEGKEIVLVGRTMLTTDNDVPDDINSSLRWDFAAAFNRELNGQLLELRPVQNNFTAVMQDQEGNRWNWLGQAISGPRQGAQLESVNGGMGYWMIFSAMYPRVEIFGTPQVNEKIEFEADENWGISTDHVARGAGFNAIPAINEPKFKTYEEVAEKGLGPKPEDLVVGLRINGEVKAYPHNILDYHEVVNDEVGGIPVTLTYCPLTGTAKVYDRSADPNDFFGVSGLLFNSNLMPFDGNTQSVWHQLEGRCVNGQRLGEQIPIIDHIETRWELWKRSYPETLVMTTETGFDRPYDRYPYGDYKTNNDFLLALLAYEDERMERKERVFAVIVNGRAKVYPASAFF